MRVSVGIGDVALDLWHMLVQPLQQQLLPRLLRVRVRVRVRVSVRVRVRVKVRVRVRGSYSSFHACLTWAYSAPRFLSLPPAHRSNQSARTCSGSGSGSGSVDVGVRVRIGLGLGLG